MSRAPNAALSAGVFFVLSKILDLAFSPLTWALALIALGALRRHGAPLRGAALYSWSAFLLLYVFSIAPVSNGLSRSLESPPMTSIHPETHYDAVIVLGGLVDLEATRATGETAFNDAIERLLAAFDLLRTGRAEYALLSGGAAGPDARDGFEAPILAKQLEAWGIDPKRLVVESSSLNTRENAVNSAKIVRARGWQRVVLVTSAFHMPRAKGCFNAVGLDADTWAVDFRTGPGSSSFVPRVRWLDESTAALREYAGRVVYVVRGYSKAAL